MVQNLSNLVENRVQTAAQRLHVANPMEYVGGLIRRSFSLPAGDSRYAVNALTPGSAPFEPSFSEREPNALRFTIQPLGPDSMPLTRRDEATREMRRLVSNTFGPDALRWFDERSEEWRGFSSYSGLNYGAWFGNAYDRDGLSASKVYYEMSPGQIDALPPTLGGLVRAARESLPALTPLFTTIACRRENGSQRVSFAMRGRLRLADLGPLMERLGMSRHLPGVMQIVGLTLGGRFDLPPGAVMVAIGSSAEGPELKLEILLDRLPDLPQNFLNLLALGLNERPRELHALRLWLQAFTPATNGWPGDFSVMSIRVTQNTSARVALYLRPVEFQIGAKENGNGDDDDDDDEASGNGNL